MKNSIIVFLGAATLFLGCMLAYLMLCNDDRAPLQSPPLPQA